MLVFSNELFLLFEKWQSGVWITTSGSLETSNESSFLSEKQSNRTSMKAFIALLLI